MISKLSSQLYLLGILFVLSSIDTFSVFNFPGPRWINLSTKYCLRLKECIHSTICLSKIRVQCNATVSQRDYNVFSWWNPLLVRVEKQVEQDGSKGEKETEISDPFTGLDVNQTVSATVALQPTSACYGNLGCITRFSFADPLLWPINLLPESREKINTHFTLYTREKPNPQVRK